MKRNTIRSVDCEAGLMPFEQADSMLISVSAAARKAGLGINFAKTEVLVVGDLARAEPTHTLSLDGVQLNRVG